MASVGVENALTIAEETANGIRLLSATQAFRKYSWLKDEIARNKSGNLRGMVISGKFKTVYKVSGAAGKTLQNAALIIKFYEESKRAQPEMERIFMSNATWEVKAAKISTQVSGICIRTLTSLVTSTAKTMSWVLRKTTSLHPLYRLDKALGTNVVDRAFDSVDGFTNQVTVFVDRKTVGNELYYIIEAKIR